MIAFPQSNVITSIYVLCYLGKKRLGNSQDLHLQRQQDLQNRSSKGNYCGGDPEIQGQLCFHKPGKVPALSQLCLDHKKEPCATEELVKRKLNVTTRGNGPVGDGQQNRRQLEQRMWGEKGTILGNGYGQASSLATKDIEKLKLQLSQKRAKCIKTSKNYNNLKSCIRIKFSTSHQIGLKEHIG